jgi:acylphosphatase
MGKARAHVIVMGRVQGVFFRYETRDVALRHNVAGWVKNRRDGDVEAVFEGDEDDVRIVIDWCKKGPPMARVEDVKLEWEEYGGEFQGFDIKY